MLRMAEAHSRAEYTQASRDRGEWAQSGHAHASPWASQSLDSEPQRYKFDKDAREKKDFSRFITAFDQQYTDGYNKRPRPLSGVTQPWSHDSIANFGKFTTL